MYYNFNKKIDILIRIDIIRREREKSLSFADFIYSSK